MIEQLFGSKTRVKLLQLFYSNPNRSFYVREITRQIDEQINSVRRELANLLSIGIVSSDNTNNKLYYEVNQKYDYYDQLSDIFGTKSVKKRQSTKPAIELEAPQAVMQNDTLKHIGNVELALYTGQFTRDESSGVDMLIVGDVNQTQIHKFVDDLEQREGKEIRYVIMSLDDYKYREQIKDKFVANIKSCKKQVITDKHNLLEL